MKIYSNLALNGIKKNKKLYLPYILTAVMMIAMFYILSFLSKSSMLNGLRSYESVKSIMGLGSFVVAIFSVIFLFYTNSFLIKRRKKEFGLYNVLGMNKHSIAKILIWESLCVSLTSVLLGLIVGIGASKLAELAFTNMVGAGVNYSFEISVEAVFMTAAIFFGIFLLILLNSIRQIRFSNPMSLVKSDSYGEKPPRANRILGTLGVLILAAAYFIAIRIQNPISALMWFFIAVIAVIVATYLIFIAGSVMMCRILQKNKKYYYKKEHFVSVSGMAYRMKRNGAGLASICILLTMVFVMISSTACLYFGTDDTCKRRYPKDMTFALIFDSAEKASEENISPIRNAIDEMLEKYNAKPENKWDYLDFELSGMLMDDGTVILEESNAESISYDRLISVHIVPLSDYAEMTGKSVSLSDNEAIAYYTDKKVMPTYLKFNSNEINVKAKVDEVNVRSSFSSDAFPNIYLFVPDLVKTFNSIMKNIDDNSDFGAEILWHYGFDVDLDEDTKEDLYTDIINGFDRANPFGEDKAIGFRYDNAEQERADYFEGVSGFLFIAVALSAIFLVAAVLIIYYKQISEGYEDRGNFEIMQKVGMTKRDIKKSIKSQMLTVFFMPIIFAVLHLIFAFPMVRKLLVLFGLNNLPLFLITCGICVLVFSLFYTLIYRMTSNSYYAIVSGNDKK